MHTCNGQCFLPGICAVGEYCVENTPHITHMLGLHHNLCVIQQKNIIIHTKQIYKHILISSALSAVSTI